MKRRRLLQTLAAAPAIPAALAQNPAQQNNRPAATSPVPPPADATTPPAPFNRTPPAAVEAAKLETATPDDVAEAKPRFFTAPQFAALKKLSSILMPAMHGAPGALETEAPEFLDFLIGESPKERQQLYRAGLDALNSEAKKRFGGKAFADVTTEQASTLLAPLKQKWTYEGPSDPLAKFLWAAKQDVRTATINSRQYASANAGGRRGFGGQGLYWHSLD